MESERAMTTKAEAEALVRLVLEWVDDMWVETRIEDAGGVDAILAALTEPQALSETDQEAALVDAYEDRPSRMLRNLHAAGLAIARANPSEAPGE